QLQATSLFYLFVSSQLLDCNANGQIRPRWSAPNVEYGHRAHRAYDMYRRMHEADALFNFEWAWALLRALSADDTLTLSRCADCGLDYIHDRLAIDFHRCPGCELRLEVLRRPGVGRFV
ncbi:MAG: hypothetical protein AAFZ58_11515, partial [Pseudomonadota bacterium]